MQHVRTKLLAIGLCTLSSAWAQGLDPGDVIVDGNQTGQIQTGFEFDSGLTFPVFVFSDDFGDGPNFSNDPGFDSLDGAFDPGTILEINLNRALHVWNGEDFWDIADSTLTISKGPVSFESPPCDQFTPGIPFGSAAGEGDFHHHPNYILNDPAEAGVYLIEVILTDQGEDLVPSEPFWIVFDNLGDAQEAAEAEQWVSDHMFQLVCLADANGDEQLNVLDFVAFQSLFANGDSRADANGDCALNVLDFVAFQAAFAEGCD